MVEELGFDNQLDEVLVQSRILEFLRLLVISAVIPFQHEFRALTLADAKNRHLRGHQRIVHHLFEQTLQ